jgi:hypothetical protein
MKHTLTLTLFAFLLCSGFTCPPGQTPEQSARDAIAAAHGWVVNAQAVWLDSCKADATQAKCVSTNKLIAAEHVAADALQTYCGGTPAPGTQAYIDGGVCVEETSLQGALQSAILNMNATSTDVQALIKKEPK